MPVVLKTSLVLHVSEFRTKTAVRQAIRRLTAITGTGPSKVAASVALRELLAGNALGGSWADLGYGAS